MVPVGSFLRWLSSTAGYVPGNEAQLSLSDIAHHKRVLSRGCYPFLSGRSENLSVFLASLSASTKGVIASANRSAFTLSQSLATPFADPFVGLKDRNLRDAESYTEKKFPGQFFVSVRVFYFAEKKVSCFEMEGEVFIFRPVFHRKTKNLARRDFSFRKKSIREENFGRINFERPLDSESRSSRDH